MESPPGGAGAGAGSGDDQDVSDPQRNKKRYHRHTARQIQTLERTFKENPHPDEKQRQQLSRELGLEARQIKFWFQNRRTQQKAQHDRQDNCSLRAENDRFRLENIAFREALKNVICTSCVGPPVASQDNYFRDQKLRIENAKLKEELERVSTITAKLIGRPISQLSSLPPVSVGSLELSMGSFGAPGITGPSLDLDLLPGALPSMPTLPFQPLAVSDTDKSLLVDVASGAMDELIRLLQAGESLWIRSPTNGRDALNLEAYDTKFPRANHSKSPEVQVEASRDSGMVIMNGDVLVDMFMDPNKWAELFPTIVLKSRIIDVLSPGMAGNRSGALLLMYQEQQVLSPLVSTREFYILRYCRQLEQGIWVIADVSFDMSRQNQFPSPQSRKLPSGCLIQDMSDGYSKVTWVEHVEVEDKMPPHRLYRDLVSSGIAFGAERWLATLQRMGERFACLMLTGSSASDLGGVIPSPEGKRGLMKLSQRMINTFCASISASNGQRWTTLSGMNDVGVRVTVHKSSDLGQPNGVVLSAATSIWLPVSSQIVFNFFRDEQSRPQWDVLSDGFSVQEVAHIANGSHPGNCVSVLRAVNASNNVLVLQESCTDSSGASLVVYSSVELSDINIAMSGEDPSYIPLLPYGFAILPDGHPGEQGASSSSALNRAGGGGSLVTVAFQILVSSLPNGKLNLESVNTVNNLISSTVQRIKAALNCGEGY